MENTTESVRQNAGYTILQAQTVGNKEIVLGENLNAPDPQLTHYIALPFLFQSNRFIHGIHFPFLSLGVTLFGYNKIRTALLCQEEDIFLSLRAPSIGTT